MPPTADSTLGLRTSMTYTLTGDTYDIKKDNTMRTVTMMSGDQTDHKHTNGYFNEEPEQKTSKYDVYFKEPCFYSHTIYCNAGKIFNALRQDTREEQENPYYRKQMEVNQTNKRTVEIPDIDFQDDAEKRLTFELAFEALKCKYKNETSLQHFNSNSAYHIEIMSLP